MSVSKIRKGLWMFVEQAFAQGPDSVKNLCERLARGAFELVIPCVKVKDGYLDYATRIGIVNPIFAKWDPLEVLCEEAGKRNIKVHPWFCIFHEGEGSKLLQRNKNLSAFRKEGTGEKTWVCAMRDEVQDYEFSLYEEVMEQYDVAGVHLDYIRTGMMCVCEHCSKCFTQQFGGDIREAVHNSEEYIKWYRWRAGNITKFVERVHKEAKKRELEVSAAVLWGYPGCIIDNGQDWGTWAEKRIVDYVIPMNYSADTPFVVSYARNHMATVAGHCELWEGLGTWHLIAQIKALKELGITGVSIFQSANKPITDKDLELLARL